MSALADVISTLHELPSPRGVALELMRLVRREDASVTDVARIVQADPALTGRLIHAANRINAGRRTGLLREAVLQLGFSATRQIALGFSLVNDYRTGRCVAFDYPAFWSGSLLRGVASQAIAARVQGVDPQEAFVCGLLAHVGRLALATAHPQAYAGLLERESGGGARLRRAERERFATDHAELGVALLERWNFPENPVRTVREFHAIMARADGYGAVDCRPAWMMVLADALAQESAPGAPPAWRQVVLDVAARLGLDADALNALVADVVREMAEWAPLLELPVPAVAAADYREYASPGPDAANQGPPLIIVLVDDNADDRYLASYALQRAGHHVHAVSSGEEALEIITSVLPQMVITDWEMPGMNGIDLCRALRATRMGDDLHLILYTGRGRDRDLVAGIEAGADDFMVKSASSDILLARVGAGARASRRAGVMAGEFRDARLAAVELAAGNPGHARVVHGA